MVYSHTGSSVFIAFVFAFYLFVSCMVCGSVCRISNILFPQQLTFLRVTLISHVAKRHYFSNNHHIKNTFRKIVYKVCPSLQFNSIKTHTIRKIYFTKSHSKYSSLTMIQCSDHVFNFFKTTENCSYEITLSSTVSFVWVSVIESKVCPFNSNFSIGNRKQFVGNRSTASDTLDFRRG